MQWLTEIFSSSSDQARLVTTLLVAAIAIAVVFINQWFASRRARKDKLIEKLEELYAAVIKLHELYLSTQKEIATGSPKGAKGVGRDSLLAMHESFETTGAHVYMLTGLYFPSLREKVVDVRKVYDDMYEGFLNAEEIQNYIGDYFGGIDDKMNRLFPTMYTDIQDAMEKTMH